MLSSMVSPVYPSAARPMRYPTYALNFLVLDTREHGKPDMVKLTYRMVQQFDAEAVVIISNEALTRKVVYGMMSRGIPAFGAIWDS